MSFHVVDVEQRSEAWIAARLGRLTGSSAKDMLAKGRGGGESLMRLGLKEQLVAEQATGKTQDEHEFRSAHTDRGVQLEPTAVGAYEDKEGVLVSRVGFLAHDELMAGVSPDGIIGRPVYGQVIGGVEVKCPKASVHLRYARGGVPSEHKAQCLHGLWLTGAQWWDFVSYCPDYLDKKLTLLVCRMERDEKLIAEYDQKVRAFLAECNLELAAMKGWSAEHKETA